MSSYYKLEVFNTECEYHLESWDIAIGLFDLKLEFHVLLRYLDDLLLQLFLSLCQLAVLNTSVLHTHSQKLQHYSRCYHTRF